MINTKFKFPYIFVHEVKKSKLRFLGKICKNCTLCGCVSTTLLRFGSSRVDAAALSVLCKDLINHYKGLDC